MNPDSEAGLRKIARAVAASATILGSAGACVAASAHLTERKHPAAGAFLDVAGVRVHYLEAGQGPALVLIHGNAMSSQDFVASGIVAELAQRYRVIAFDRPGFGYTERPRTIAWTPLRQAELIHEALAKLQIVRPIVVGHSLGALVAAALAIAHPSDTRALVLLSGFYFANLPLGLPLFPGTTAPLVGDVMRYTVFPIASRVMQTPVTQQMFAPAAVTDSFAGYPLSMSRRPSQIRATLEDANFINAAAGTLEKRYAELTMPVEILAGDGDMVVNTWTQSKRLADGVSSAHFETIEGAGHMIHHIAPNRIVSAIDAAAARVQTAGSLADARVAAEPVAHSMM